MSDEIVKQDESRTDAGTLAAGVAGVVALALTKREVCRAVLVLGGS